MPTIDEKRERAKRMGIPMPVTQMPINEGATSAIPVTSANADMHARLQALKSGAKRGDMSNLVNAKKGAEAGGFQPLPEPKMKKNPNHPGNQVSDPKFKVNPDAGLPPVPKSSGNPELDAIDAMFGGNSVVGSYSMPTYDPGVANTTQPDLTVNQNGYGPDFNPHRMIAEKKAKMQEDNSYLQYASQVSAEQMANAMGNQVQGQAQFDFENMKKMMEQIARNTISEVLDNYTEKNKGKLTVENYIKTKDGYQVVKAQDGKYYKMIPVSIKKKD